MKTRLAARSTKFEFGELHHRGLADGGLSLPRVGVERPALGQSRSTDPVLEEAHLLALIFFTQ